jgi:hypothetical protein
MKAGGSGRERGDVMQLTMQDPSRAAAMVGEIHFPSRFAVARCCDELTETHRQHLLEWTCFGQVGFTGIDLVENTYPKNIGTDRV